MRLLKTLESVIAVQPARNIFAYKPLYETPKRIRFIDVDTLQESGRGDQEIAQEQESSPIAAIEIALIHQSSEGLFAISDDGRRVVTEVQVERKFMTICFDEIVIYQAAAVEFRFKIFVELNLFSQRAFSADSSYFLMLGRNALIALDLKRKKSLIVKASKSDAFEQDGVLCSVCFREICGKFFIQMLGPTLTLINVDEIVDDWNSAEYIECIDDNSLLQ